MKDKQINATQKLPWRPKTHWLKIEPAYFLAHEAGVKHFEIRYNDRDFRVGDMVVLQKWDGKFMGETLTKQITYISDYPVALKQGFVVLQLK